MNYFGSGVLPYYIDKNDKVYILLLHETRIDTYTTEIQQDAYIDLGGKVEFHDIDPAYTAIREMNEESQDMYKDLTLDLLNQIRSNQNLSFNLKGKKPYFIFCIKVPFRKTINEKLEWVPLLNILKVPADKLNNYLISSRLLELLHQKGVKQKLALLG